MKRIVKGYLVFTSLGYRMAMYLVIPLTLLGIQIFFSGPGQSYLLSFLFLPVLEIVADNWFLGGIQEKNAEKLDYLKTSSKGMKIMENTLTMDLVRRFMTAMFIFGSCFLMNRFFYKTETRIGAGLILPVLICYVLSVLGTLITRFQSWLWVNMVVGYIAALVGMVFLMMVMFHVIPVPATNIVFGVLAVALSIAAVKTAMVRVKGGYYDK